MLVLDGSGVLHVWYVVWEAVGRITTSTTGTIARLGMGMGLGLTPIRDLKQGEKELKLTSNVRLSQEESSGPVQAWDMKVAG